jgi:hypothetical protein
MSFLEFSDRIGYLEHLARYRFALSFVEDKVVLDLGCGGRDGPLKGDERRCFLLGRSPE